MHPPFDGIIVYIALPGMVLEESCNWSEIVVPLPPNGGVRMLVQIGAPQENVVVGKFDVRAMEVVCPEQSELGLAGFELAVGRGSTVTTRSFVIPKQPSKNGVIW